MAYDPGHETLLREDLGAALGPRADELDERRMFGGLCFMMAGNMLCGVHKRGLMYRVGKDRAEAALAIPGAQPMAFTGRPMGGMIELYEDDLGRDDTRKGLLALAVEFVDTLAPK
ncbi:TfoX/Sxy family protein [Primorskyibacter aestuariivivens]|uniref:TfoX/Sxy family protein n=1 Tax=Primorskyibacter aestuariivivens TaxID=1888912 RepID=UPI00230106C0|nr:TfoX/Sxy family protein [Primorskyibacter aestuariivivens]MDA7429815.1 TfoX/Sxy family protein [Primorskyibacter aestuariivivens]